MKDSQNKALRKLLNDQVGKVMIYTDGRYVRVIDWTFRVEKPYRWKYTLEYLDTHEQFVHKVKGAIVEASDGDKELFT